MKEKLKNNYFLYSAYKKFKDKFNSIDFMRDRTFFLKNYMFSSNKNHTSHDEYNLMLLIHQLEKGMTSQQLRPFGIDKVKNMIKIINGNPSIIDDNNYYYNYSISILNQYVNIYEKNKWTNNNEYKIVKSFLKDKKYQEIKSGSYDLKCQELDNNIDYLKFVNSRHSIRNFSDKKLKKEDILAAVNMAIKSPSACNRQMCKIYYISDNKNVELMKQKSQGLSLFDLDNVNFFIITFDVSANSFIGERNQGWFNSGLFAMNFVNGLHSLGIGSCFIQFGNSFKDEMKIKKELNIPSSERIAVILAAGYYPKVAKIPYSTRKDTNSIYFER